MSRRAASRRNNGGAAPMTLPAWPEMVDGCRRLTVAVPEIILPTHRFSIVQVRPYRMPIGWSVNLHEHAFYEASLLLDGATRYPGTEQPLGPGHVYFHGPHVPHDWAANQGECRRLIFWFTVEPAVSMPEPSAWPVLPDVLADAVKLLDLLRKPSPGWQNQAAARLGIILSRLIALGDLPLADSDARKTTEQLVSQVDAFLADNFRHTIRLDDVANTIGVSMSGLIHRYRQVTGSTVGQKLLELRMDETVHLLKTTDLPLKSICQQVGLTDPAYLCRLFRRYYRTSPGEYRAAVRQDQE